MDNPTPHELSYEELHLRALALLDELDVQPVLLDPLRRRLWSRVGGVLVRLTGWALRDVA